MDIKTLEYLHALLVREEERLNARMTAYRKAQNELEEYYGVRVWDQSEDMDFYATDHVDQWNAEGKARHAEALEASCAAEWDWIEAVNAKKDFEGKAFFADGR